MNWEQIINDAEKRGWFSMEEMRAASGWIDCACGSQDERIPRNPDGAPVDIWLFVDGTEFSFAVNGNNFDEARRLLNRIEERAFYVLMKVESEDVLPL